MFQRGLSFTGFLAVAAALLLAPDRARAQFRVFGFRGFVPLYNPYGFYPYYGPSYGPYGMGYSPYGPAYYPRYYPSPYPTYPATYPATTYQPDNTRRDQATTSPSAPQPKVTEFPPATAPETNPPPARPAAAEGKPARIEVRLPDDAALWFDGVKTKQKGEARTFVTPPLAPGQEYAYDLRAEWREKDQSVTEARHVTIRAGDRVTVDFSKQPAPPPETLTAPKPAKP
jgi:uncharacterized protein (TIGR03000 family)